MHLQAVKYNPICCQQCSAGCSAAWTDPRQRTALPSAQEDGGALLSCSCESHSASQNGFQAATRERSGPVSSPTGLARPGRLSIAAGSTVFCDRA